MQDPAMMGAQRKKEKEEEERKGHNDEENIVQENKIMVSKCLLMTNITKNRTSARSKKKRGYQSPRG